MKRKPTYEYDPKLKKLAREQRNFKHQYEVLMWNQLRKRRFKDLFFSRQKPIGNYIVDFFCFEYKLVIELDGESHNDKQIYDAKRDEYLRSLGLQVIHILNEDMSNSFDGVMKWLHEHPVFKTPQPPFEKGGHSHPI